MLIVLRALVKDGTYILELSPLGNVTRIPLQVFLSFDLKNTQMSRVLLLYFVSGNLLAWSSKIIECS